MVGKYIYISSPPPACPTPWAHLVRHFLKETCKDLTKEGVCVCVYGWMDGCVRVDAEGAFKSKHLTRPCVCLHEYAQRRGGTQKKRFVCSQFSQNG